VVPRHVAAWRDSLKDAGLTNSSVRCKMTVLRSLFSYLHTYGYAGVNPAHGDFVEAPPVPRDGKTVGHSPEDCRRLLDAPATETPVGIRDRALLAVLGCTGCRRRRDRLPRGPARYSGYVAMLLEKMVPSPGWA
jgi:integrase/recombinase XerD